MTTTPSRWRRTYPLRSSSDCFAAASLRAAADAQRLAGGHGLGEGAGDWLAVGPVGR